MLFSLYPKRGRRRLLEDEQKVSEKVPPRTWAFSLHNWGLYAEISDPQFPRHCPHPNGSCLPGPHLNKRLGLFLLPHSSWLLLAPSGKTPLAKRLNTLSMGKDGCAERFVPGKNVPSSKTILVLCFFKASERDKGTLTKLKTLFS